MKHIKLLADKSMTMQANENFRYALRSVLGAYRPAVVFESGTFWGEGSTRELAHALREHGVQSTIYTVEVNPEYFLKARANLVDYPEVVPLLGMSIDRAKALDFLEHDPLLANHQQVENIYIDDPDDPKGFYLRELKQAPSVRDKLLVDVQRHFGPINAVLLDSAGGLGWLEFTTFMEVVKNECLVILDDINHLKHWRSFEYIRTNPREFDLLDYETTGVGWLIAIKNARPCRRRRGEPAAIGQMPRELRPRGAEMEVLEKHGAGLVTKILVVLHGEIFDVLLAEPFCAALRSRYPAAEITVLVSEGREQIVSAFASVDRVIKAPVPVLARPGLDAALLDAESFSLVVDSAAVPASAARARDYLHALCQLSGIDMPQRTAPLLDIPRTDKESCFRDWHSRFAGRPVVAVSTQLGKHQNWPPPLYAALIQALTQAGIGVLHLRDAGQAPFPGCFDVSSGSALRAAELIARADLFLGGCGDAAALSVSVGTPSILIGPHPEDGGAGGLKSIAPDYVVQEFAPDANPQAILDLISSFMSSAAAWQARRQSGDELLRPAGDVTRIQFVDRIGNYDFYRDLTTGLVQRQHATNRAAYGDTFFERYSRHNRCAVGLEAVKRAEWPLYFEQFLHDVVSNDLRASILEVLRTAQDTDESRLLFYEIETKLAAGSSSWGMAEAVAALAMRLRPARYLEVGLRNSTYCSLLYRQSAASDVWLTAAPNAGPKEELKKLLSADLKRFTPWDPAIGFSDLMTSLNAFGADKDLPSKFDMIVFTAAVPATMFAACLTRAVQLLNPGGVLIAEGACKEEQRLAAWLAARSSGLSSLENYASGAAVLVREGSPQAA